jgi:hypothetical protein
MDHDNNSERGEVRRSNPPWRRAPITIDALMAPSSQNAKSASFFHSSMRKQTATP